MEVSNFKELYGEGYTHHFIITKNVYKSFQICSGDKNPLHTNELFARNKGFQTKVMYGNILNAFISYFVGECLPTKDVIIHSQDISYTNPVYMNDKLRLESKIECVFESVNAIEFKYKFINQNNKVVAKGHVQIGLLL